MFNLSFVLINLWREMSFLVLAYFAFICKLEQAQAFELYTSIF